MKKTILFLLLSVFITGYSFAQQTFKVQGHPRTDVTIKESKNSKSNTGTDPNFTMDSIKFWVGEGENRAALAIDWYDDKGGTLVWGYRWNEGTTAYGIDMVEAIVKADPRLTGLKLSGTAYGSAIGGLGYDLDGRGSQCLILNGNTDPQCPVDGFVFTTSYNFDSFAAADPNDHWRSGWTSGYWSYNTRDGQNSDFEYSSAGASTRELTDGCWDGWGYQDGWDNFGGTAPRYPYAAAIPPSVSVTSISINYETLHFYTNESKQLTVSILPENATNKKVSWESSNTAVATTNAEGMITALAEGTTNIIVTAEDGMLADTCIVEVEKLKYNDGVLFVNEDWFGHNNSTINFIDKYGNWHYRVYQKENTGKELGCSSPYGTIYGDKFFIISKQAKDPGANVTGSRLAVCNAETMVSLAEFTDIGGADGRSFLGVDEHKGYISTSNGIYSFDIDNLTIGEKLKGSENSTSSLYTGQIGTMVRAADKVFAVNQQKGLLVIDIKGDSVTTVISAPKDGTKQRGFGSIVQSKDGNLWLSVASNVSGNGNAEEYMLKLNPQTLDTTRVALPKGASIPNSWYAWTADGFCASTQHNKLYWKNNGGWFNSTKIYEYDIDNNETKIVIDISTYEPSETWGIYGAGFRLDPRTDDIYVSLFQSFGSPTYKVVKVSTSTGELTHSYPMESNYWFPAMPVFPDQYAPVVSDQLTNMSINAESIVYLGDKATDVDNINAAIVKTIVSISNDDILTANIQNDSLTITPIIGKNGVSNIEIQFNSNGKIVAKTIAITVEIPVIDVTSVKLNTNSISLKTEETYQLSATVLPENATNKGVKWSSSNTNIVTVDDNGLVAAIAVGNATVTVETEDGTLSDSCTITVETAIITATSVKLNTNSISLKTEETYQLSATVLPENATNKGVKWSSSNTNIVTVDDNGLVTAIAVGNATVTVETEDGTLSDSCTITVETAIITATSVKLNTNSISLKTEETYQLSATVLPENATNKGVKWSSSNTNIVTVDDNGLVTAIAVGNATVTVETEDGTLSDSCTITTAPNGIHSIVDNNIQVYPTVTTGLITIIQEGISEVQVLNISGKVLQTIELQSSETTIDLSPYTSGLYLIRIGDKVTKVIKK